MDLAPGQYTTVHSFTIATTFHTSYWYLRYSVFPTARCGKYTASFFDMSSSRYLPFSFLPMNLWHRLPLQLWTSIEMEMFFFTKEGFTAAKRFYRRQELSPRSPDNGPVPWRILKGPSHGICQLWFLIIKHLPLHPQTVSQTEANSPLLLYMAEDTAESTSSSNITMNSKLYGKNSLRWETVA